MDINSLYSELEGEYEDGLGYNISENFTQLLLIIKSDLAKCKYRKVFTQLSTVNTMFSQLKNYWKVTELKLEAILKTISKKIFRYIPGQKKSYPLKALDNWFVEAAEVLEEWGENISTLENNEEQVNAYIYYTIWEIYLHSLHLKHQNRYFEVTLMLSIAERLIKEHSTSCVNPKTLNLCQKIFLFISSILIADGSYETAKMYQYYALQLIIKEYFYRSNLDDRVLTEPTESSEQLTTRGMFTNFSIAFYQRGVCEEHLDNIDRALECYRQSNWAAKKFMRAKVPEFVQFIHYLEDKMFKYQELLKILIKESIQRERDRELGKKAIKQIGKESIDEKYDKIREEVEKVIAMIPESPLEQNKNEESSKKYIMSTMHLVEKLLSPEFRQIVRESGDLKIFDMDREFREKVKKKISHLRIAKMFNDKAKELFSSKNKLPSLMDIYSLVKLNNEKKMTSVCNTQESFARKKSFTKSGADYTKVRAQSALTGETAYTNTHNRIQSTVESQKEIIEEPNKETLRSKKSESVKFFLVSEIKNKNCVYKIKHDSYVFSNRFKKKIDYLTNIEKKELNFQKKLLKLKRYEKIPYDTKDENEINLDVQGFFEKTIKNKINNNIEAQADIKVETNTNQKKIRKHFRLERTIIQSLDVKKYEEFSDFLKKRESQVTLNTEFLLTQSLDKDLPIKEIERQKTHIVNDLNKKLELIDERQKNCMKIINPARYKTPTYTARKSVTKFEKPFSKMDDFVKFTMNSHHRNSIYTASFKK